MLSSDAIDVAHGIREPGISHSLLYRFLFELEGRIALEIQGRSEWVQEDVLSVPAPYDRIYWLYLVMMIDLLYGDKERYLRTKEAFQEAFDAYTFYYRSKHGSGN